MNADKRRCLTRKLPNPSQIRVHLYYKRLECSCAATISPISRKGAKAQSIGFFFAPLRLCVNTHWLRLCRAVLQTFKFFATHGNSLGAQSSQSSAKFAKGKSGDSFRCFLCDLRVFANFALKSRVDRRCLRLGRAGFI